MPQSEEFHNTIEGGSHENEEPFLFSHSLSDRELLDLWHSGLNTLYRRHCKQWRKNTTEYTRAWSWDNPYFRSLVYYYKAIGFLFGVLVVFILIVVYDIAILAGFIRPTMREVSKGVWVSQGSGREISEPVELFFYIPWKMLLMTMPFLGSLLDFRHWYPTYRQLKQDLQEGKNPDEHDSFRIQGMRGAFFSWAKPNHYVHFDEKTGQWRLHERFES